MKPGWRVVAAAAAAYFFFLLATAPAAKILPLLRSQMPAVQLAGVGGSLWSGEAVQVNAGAVVLTEVKWSLRLLALFKGALEVDIDAQLDGRPIGARAGRGLFGGRYLQDVNGQLSAGRVLRLLNVKTMDIDGQLAVSLDAVEWDGAALPGVTGRLDWTPALVNRPIELNLGSARIDATVESGVTTGQLTASGGALTVQGEILLQPDGSYRLDANLKKQGAVPDAVDKFLSTFTEFRDDSYRLEWSDKLQF